VIQIFCLIVALTFAVLCDVYDTTISEKGIKSGVAVEANYTWLYGTDKPSLFQYYIVNLPIVFLTAVPAVVLYFLHNPGLFYGALAGPIAIGAKHIQGGLEWRKLGVKL
jgi:hypothetical protein